MLNDYIEKQAVAYNILMNEIKSNHLSHAYLIDENGNSESFNMIMAFIKEILCINLNNVDKQILCKRIDDGNYPEIKVIEPDGMLIKKQQIIDLQQEFSRVAIEGNKRIYIIRDADRMRSETANSMLKFLEEPDVDVMAILMTNNFNLMLPTIISRCQIVRLNNNAVLSVNSELDKMSLNFIQILEKKGIKTILDEQKIIFDVINSKERDKFIVVFDKMIDMYYDILKISNGSKYISNIDDYSVLKEIAALNDSDSLIIKINCLIEMKDTIKNNVNINLLIDNLIINFGGVH